MSLDGAFLSLIKKEIETQALDARIDRIYQPSREELVLGLRGRGWGARLLLSANADSARVHFTESRPENPPVPPMFCMLLRKLLGSARLSGVRQLALDRILFLDFDTRNELGDPVTYTLAVEIMGRHSNIILLEGQRIIDSVKRVDADMSAVRQILPGMTYVLPPQQDKLNLFEADHEQMLARILGGRDVALSKAVMDAVMGLSPIVCREVAHFATMGMDLSVSQLEEKHIDRLRFYLKSLVDIVREGKPSPTLVQQPKGGPKDFAFLDIRQYGHAMLTRGFESCSELLDAFFAERSLSERMRQRGGDLLRLLVNTSERLQRKIAAQEQELLESADREKLHIYGDLIHANLYQIEKGASSVTVPNYYDENLAEITIPLDPALSPVQNAQRYYNQYRRADNAEKKLRELIEQSRADYEYIDTVFDNLTRARTEAELIAIREELAEQGFARYSRGKNRKPVKLPPLQYRSSDGYTILCGRNNIQNDQLTLKQAKNYDLWLHTQKIPGSHVIIVSQGGEIPNRTIEEAAIIAATNSKARQASGVPVDYAHAKFVKKPRGAKPGMVIYTDYRTAFVDPSEEKIASMLVEE